MIETKNEEIVELSFKKVRYDLLALNVLYVEVDHGDWLQSDIEDADLCAGEDIHILSEWVIIDINGIVNVIEASAVELKTIV